MQKRPNGGQKRTHEGSIYAPVTLDARITTVNLVHGNGASGRGKYFLLRLRRWMHLVTLNRKKATVPCEKMRFSVNRDESSREFEMSQLFGLVLLGLVTLLRFTRRVAACMAACMTPSR